MLLSTEAVMKSYGREKLQMPCLYGKRSIIYKEICFYLLSGDITEDFCHVNCI